MNPNIKGDSESFHFHQIHSLIKIGTASDRYAGWVGQIYSEKRYQGRINRRSKVIGGQSLDEEVLPVDSVEEYFEHFPVLEIDFTFYRPLLDKSGKPTQNFLVLQKYCGHLKGEDHLLLKVPQVITATVKTNPQRDSQYRRAIRTMAHSRMQKNNPLIRKMRMRPTRNGRSVSVQPVTAFHAA